MEEKRETRPLLLLWDIAVLGGLLGAILYRLKKGLSVNQLFAIFWGHETGKSLYRFLEEKRKYDMVMTILNAVNGLLFVILANKEQKEDV